jgi:two-component system chemotaxis response regulator CheY
MTNQRVLSVGQCGADHWAISRTLQKAFGTEVVTAHTAAEALEQLRSAPFAMVLVNRVFDADGSSGTEFIRQLRKDESLHSVPVMLVSNYEDAQAEAVTAGAVPGFGKAALGQPHMLGRVAPFLQREGS